MLLYKGITVLGITLPVVGGSKNGQTIGLECPDLVVQLECWILVLERVVAHSRRFTE